MVKDSSQNGSAHTVIIIGLVIALIGPLGFIFWQNFVTIDSQKNESSLTNTPTTSTNDVKSGDENKGMDTSTVMNLHNGPSVSVTYPEGWEHKGGSTLFKTVGGVLYRLGFHAMETDYLKDGYQGEASVVNEVTTAKGTKLYVIKTAHNNYAAISSCEPVDGSGCAIKSGGKYIFILLTTYEKGDQYPREVDFSKDSTNVVLSEVVAIAESLDL
ncbi:MAG TPA: hypothetical protein VFM68_03530 [Candidatus Saccharimonadales bacterium]|nr:hypothetical protein [Candidatus Saccharimonadales bacterium]